MTTLTIQLTNCAVVPVYKGFVPLVHFLMRRPYCLHTVFSQSCVWGKRNGEMSFWKWPLMRVIPLVQIL